MNILVYFAGDQLQCRVMLQKETADGLKDALCGDKATAGCAGLCE